MHEVLDFIANKHLGGDFVLFVLGLMLVASVPKNVQISS